MTSAPASPAIPPAAPAVPPAQVRLILAILVVSAFVMVLNETVLSVALRDLSAALDVPATTTQWLTSGFLLTMAVVIPMTGFLLERFSPRRMFIAAMACFSAGTLVGALAPGFGVLMAARVLQACGTAVMIPLLLTTVMRLVPVQRRGATMGTITIVIALAPALGPTAGGAILAALDWRWLFLLVLPLAVAGLLLGVRLLQVPASTRSVPLDVPSVVLSAVGFGGVLYGLSAFGEGSGDGRRTALVAIAAGLVAVVAFVWRQARLQREERALLDLRAFAHRDFAVAVGVSALVFLCFLGAAAILLPLFLQTVRGVSTFVSGLAVLPGGVVLGLMGRPVGALYDRVGARRLLIPGATAMTVALWMLTILDGGSPLALVVAIHVLLMVGLGLMITPLMTDGLSALPDRLHSHGSAILTTLQQVAGAFGTALFVTVAASASLRPAGVPDAAGLRAAFVVGGCVALVALASTFLVRGARPGTVAGPTGA